MLAKSNKNLRIARMDGKSKEENRELRISRKYCIGYICNGKNYLKFFVPESFLPFEGTFNAEQIIFECFLGYYDEFIKDFVIIQKLKPGPFLHGYKITLKVDADKKFISCETQQFLNSTITRLSLVFDDVVISRIPIIAFGKHFFYIFLHFGEENGYNFLNSWNGMNGNEIIIGFVEEKPKVGQDAVTAFKSQPSVCVWDLLSIMAQSPDRIVLKEEWTFKITNDSEHPVLLGFNDHEGIYKEASPAFLMGIYIKAQLRAIRKETGKRQKEIGIRLIEFGDNEFVKKGLEEACKLLKIKYTFV